MAAPGFACVRRLFAALVYNLDRRKGNGLMESLHVLVCPDALKGSLTAVQAASALAAGVRDAVPAATIRQLPLADGGEGTATALVTSTGGHFVSVTVTGPAGRPVSASYGVLGDGQTAVIEAASAAGLEWLDANDRDPRQTTSAGVGELMRAALTAGFRKLIITLGGSGANDGGLGLWTGLGGRVEAANGEPAGHGGAALARAQRLVADGLPDALDDADMIVATDVDNPLLGPSGATVVYGPQKGADPGMVAELEHGMANWASLLATTFGRNVSHIRGAGAAGGMAAPLLAMGKARVVSGFDLVADYSGLVTAIRAADVIMTAEGRLDGQTLRGKVIHGVARLAREHHKPCIAIGGSVAPGAEALLDEGVTAMLALPRGPAALADLMDTAAPLLRHTANQAMRIFMAGRHR